MEIHSNIKLNYLLFWKFYEFAVFTAKIQYENRIYAIHHQCSIIYLFNFLTNDERFSIIYLADYSAILRDKLFKTGS